jgi:aryl-alcohol dehydrogenase-like predicted oxidoreductase
MATSTTDTPTMPYVRLGNSGLKVSRICLGCMSYGSPKWRPWVLDEEASLPFFEKALELGINFWDTANMYSAGESERVVGTALKKYLPGRRDEIVLATKVFFPTKPGPNNGGLSRKHIMQSIDDSLKRLGTDYVDIYQFHRWDYDTPIEETIEALHDLVRAGKIRYIGGSSCNAYQFSKAIQVAKHRGLTQFVSMQNHYNLIYREEEREMNPLCVSEGVGLIPWSPLARGLLAGSRKKKDALFSGETLRSQTDEFSNTLYSTMVDNDFEVIDRVTDLAEKKHAKPAQIALAWLLHKPNVAAPIVGATKMEHLIDACGSVHIKLTEDEIKYLEEVYKPHPVAGHR